MGKGDKRRRRKRKLKAVTGWTAPEVAPVPRRKARGWARMQEIERDAIMPVLEARARRVGYPVSRDGIDRMRAQMLAEPAGEAIWLAVDDDDERARLWQVYAGFTNAERLYFAVVIGRQIRPEGSRAEVASEPVEALEGDVLSELSDDERVTAVANGWMTWRGRLMQLSRAHQLAIIVVAHATPDHGMPPLLRDGSLTARGRAFIEAVEALADVVDPR